MGDDDLREILERLETLERLARSRSGGGEGWEDHRRGGRDRHDHGRGGRDRHDHGRSGRDRHDHGRSDRDRGRGDGEFQEKRIIDTIVQLVGERVERGIQDRIARTQRRDDGGTEKRIVDLVVRLVGERVKWIVQEVVSNELDRRRLGRPDGQGPAGDPPQSPSNGSEEH